MKPTQFELAQPILERLTTHGYEAYFVGGAVRDYLMKRPIHDVDITTNATPDEIEALFDHTIPIGKEHGTINVVWAHENYEVTTFRAEAEYVDHRRPTEVFFVRDLYQDVERRDFTMNAIAMDTHYHLIDFFAGEQDIAQGLIRTVGDAVSRFDEDALRILRGLRFKSQLGFKIVPETFEGMQRCISDIQYLSIERLMSELSLLVNGSFVKETLPLLHQLELWNHIPFFKTMNIPSIQLESPVTIEWFLALIDYQFGPLSFKPLKLSNSQNKTIQKLSHALQQVQSIDSKSACRHFIYDFGLDIAIELVTQRKTLHLNRIHLPNITIFNTPLIQEIWEHLPIYGHEDIAIDGKQLMQAFNLKGGPWIKAVLHRVELAIIDNELHNETEAIIEWVRTNVKIS